MTDWDYENDFYSQKLSHTLCQRLRRLNVLLIGLHRRIDESLHPEGFLTVLEVLQDTKEIILGVEHTFFYHRRLRAFREATPRSGFVDEVMKSLLQEQEKKEEKNYDE